MNLIFRALISLATFVAILSALPTSSVARIVLKEKTKYYSVSGNNGQEIFSNMLEKGPKIKGRSGHFLAITEIEYDIQNFKMDVVDGRCVTRNFDLIVRAGYTYPKWRGSNKAKSATRKAWKRFSREVVWHEKQHVNIAMDIAKEMEKVLRTTKGRASRNCNDISWKIGLKARRIGTKHNRLQKRFDRTDLRRGGRGYKAQSDLMKN